MGRRAHAVPAFIDLHEHHLHRDDGVIHQQSQRDDERAQSDAVQVDAHEQHDQKRQAQRQRHGHAHHQTGAHADGQHAHAHHHGHRHQELHLEQADRAVDGIRLVGQHVHRHAQGQGAALLRQKRVDAFAELKAVDAFAHDHAEQDRVLSARAHQVTRRVFVAAVHGGDVAHLDHAVAHPDRHRGQGAGVRQVGVQAQVQTRSGGFDAPSGHQPVARVNRVEHRLGRDAQTHQTRVVEFEEHALGPLAQDQGFLDAGDALQAVADVLGLAREFAHGHAGRGHGDQVEVNIGEVVVDPRAHDPIGHLRAGVLHAFAHLVEQLGHLGLGRGVLKLHLQIRLSGSDRRFDAVQVGDALQAFLQAVDHLLLHVLWCGPGPSRVDHDHAHRESRVFGAAECVEGVDAREDRQDQKEQGDRALAHGQRRPIHGAHGASSRTAMPSCNKWVPKATTRASGGSCPRMRACSSLKTKTSTAWGCTAPLTNNHTRGP